MKSRGGEVGKGKGHRAAPREKQHLHPWFGRALSQQGLGNCHPSQSCLWSSWLKTGSSQCCCSWTSSSWVQAQHTWSSRITAECPAGKCRAHLTPKAGGKDQHSGSKPISRLSELLSTKGSWSAHTPLSHLPSLLKAHSYPFPSILVSLRPSMRWQEFIASQHLGLASACGTALALGRTWTLTFLSPHVALAFQWGEQQFSNNSGNFVPWWLLIPCCYRSSKSLPTCWKPWDLCQKPSKSFKAFRRESRN